MACTAEIHHLSSSFGMRINGARYGAMKAPNPHFVGEYSVINPVRIPPQGSDRVVLPGRIKTVPYLLLPSLGSARVTGNSNLSLVDAKKTRELG